MSVATYDQPNHIVPPHDDATKYKNAIEASIKVIHEVAGQFAAHEAAVPDMTIVIDAGRVMNGITLTHVAAQATAAIIAPVTNPRIDRIVIDTVTGAYLIVAGTESVGPVAPAIPAGKVPCCQIALATSTTVIVNSLITDERALISNETIIKPMFRAYANTYHAHSAGAEVKFDAIDIDTTNDFNIATHRWTPSQAGYYFVAAKIRAENWHTGGAWLSMVLQKNSTDSQYALNRQDSGAVQTLILEVSDLIYMNGTTDYVNVELQENAQIINGSANTSFIGYKV